MKILRKVCVITAAVLLAGFVPEVLSVQGIILASGIENGSGQLPETVPGEDNGTSWIQETVSDEDDETSRAPETVSDEDDETSRASETVSDEDDETSKASETAADDNDKTSCGILVTIFPFYDWVNNILGTDNYFFDVTWIYDNGVDPHSYQPTVSDIVRISRCDVFIYAGGESDEWVEAALDAAPSESRVVINLLDILGQSALEEELAEGMQTRGISLEHAAEDTSVEQSEAAWSETARSEPAGAELIEPGTAETMNDDPEYDEHVWLSLKNAQLFVEEIARTLAGIDVKNADYYMKNARSYEEQLAALDSEYEETVAQARVKTLVFGDRFPFRYMTEDYGLDYYAAFPGCSAEADASFKTIIFLADKIDEQGLNAVITIEGSDGRIADTVIRAARTKGVERMTLNSLQSVSRKNADEGLTYLSVMKDNLEVLKLALIYPDAG